MWGGTSSLPVRFVLSVLERGITDKGEVSLYSRGYASPSNTIKSSFILNKSVFQCYLCHPDKGLHIPPLPLPTEHLCMWALQDATEGAGHSTALLLLLMTVTCDRHWVLLRDCLAPHPLGGHSHRVLNTPSPPLRARHCHKTGLLCFPVFAGIISLRWILGRNAKKNGFGEGRLWYMVESIVLGMVPPCHARRFVWLQINCYGLWLSAACSALSCKIKSVHSSSGC